MNEWAEGVDNLVDVLVVCALTSALIALIALASSIMRAVDNDRAASADLLEYRVAMMYNEEQCYSQDVVSLVLEHQGNPAVYVTEADGTSIAWELGNFTTQLTTADISAALNPDSMYYCTLTYDANGSLTAYNFREMMT